MELASIITAIAALLFTIGSFWWLQARRGRVVCMPVQSFSGYLGLSGARLRIPLLLYNTGAVPIVVVNVRLGLETVDGVNVPMTLQTFHRSLDRRTDDFKDFAQPFVVPGRHVITRHAEFATYGPPTSLLTGEAVTVVIEAVLDQTDRWGEIGRFRLHVEAMAHTERYITYTNEPDSWPDGLLAEASEAHDQLRTAIGSADENDQNG